jgi:hypothetical protein
MRTDTATRSDLDPLTALNRDYCPASALMRQRGWMVVA